MTTEQIHGNAVLFVMEQLREMDYPIGHPFDDYPHTPQSMALEYIILIKVFTNKNNIVIDFLKKCKSVEYGDFSWQKYNQNISEVIWFHYLYMGLIESDKINLLVDIYNENTKIYDNGKKFEFSFLLSDFNNCLVTSEVKAITCDPFVKENGLKFIDGKRLIKPLFPDLRDSQELIAAEEENNFILKASTYYYQVGTNVKKIINKCRGKNISGRDLFNIGVIFINSATSFEEFYSYLFHKTKGIYPKLQKSNVDALVLISMDAYNDLTLNNIYEMGYVQTVLVNPTERNKSLCKIFRIDSYLALGNDINADVYKKGQEEFGKYKILCREGFVNIIPQDTTEEEIKQYLQYLKSYKIRT